MKAVVYSDYGSPSVVSLADVPKPVARPREVLVRVHATTVTTADWRARSLQMPAGFGLLGRLVFGVFGPRKPVLGTELSGVIEAVGAEVTRFKVGDAVFAFTGADYGCHAEYRVLSENGLIARKPDALSFEEAAAMSFGGTTALRFLKVKGGVQRGERVLIVGASGSVGSAAVQIARREGAEVTGVCSAAHRAFVRSLGAARVIDYNTEDFAAEREAYDIILDATGTAPYSRCERALKQGGRLLVVEGSLAQAMGFERPTRESGKRVIAGVVSARVEDLNALAAMAEAGEFRPLIDQSFPLARAAEAHARVDSRHKRGNVVMTTSHMTS